MVKAELIWSDTVVRKACAGWSRSPCECPSVCKGESGGCLLLLLQPEKDGVKSAINEVAFSQGR